MPDERSTMTPEQLETMEKELGLELAESFYGLRIGHNAVALDELQKGNQIVRSLAKKTQELCLGKDEPPSGDDMGVSVGNKITNYYGMATPASEPEVARPNIAPASAATGSLAKTLLVSAALVAGPGIAVAIPWALGAFDKPDVPAAAAVTDTDTQYELRIGGGGK